MTWNSGGIKNFLDARPGEIEKCNEKASYILSYLRNVAESGKPAICTGEMIRAAWRFQYNPEKGETSEGEFKRYLEHLGLAGVRCFYHEIKDEYHFDIDPNKKQP